RLYHYLIKTIIITLLLWYYYCKSYYFIGGYKMKKALILLSCFLTLGLVPMVSAETTKFTPIEESFLLAMNEEWYDSEAYISLNPDDKVFSIVISPSSSEEFLQVRNNTAEDFLMEDILSAKTALVEFAEVMREKLGSDYSLRILNGKDVGDAFFIFTESKNKDTVFTNDVSENEPDSNQVISQEYKNALDTAYSYANIMNMSKQGIYDQLVSEYGSNFPEDAAQYAIDNLDVDWNYNALQTAKSFYENMSMSKQTIYEQLISEH